MKFSDNRLQERQQSPNEAKMLQTNRLFKVSEECILKETLRLDKHFSLREIIQVVKVWESCII